MKKNQGRDADAFQPMCGTRPDVGPKASQDRTGNEA